MTMEPVAQVKTGQALAKLQDASVAYMTRRGATVFVVRSMHPHPHMHAVIWPLSTLRHKRFRSMLAELGLRSSGDPLKAIQSLRTGSKSREAVCGYLAGHASVGYPCDRLWQTNEPVLRTQGRMPARTCSVTTLPTC